MAVVDAAYQVGPGGRIVALKRIAAAFANDASARRLFLREASIVTRLEHPNIVRTYEVGVADGEAFIAMELLEGATLSALQRAPGGVPLPIALRIVRDALRGLHGAHELRAVGGKPLGLVHQDVSPQNIHVAHEGTTRILDFGVARLAAVDASRTDSVRGKACYLAPEQLNLGSIDRRADVFAIGIVLHELLTGAWLFPRVPADAAYAAILSGNIPSPRAIRPSVPEELAAVTRRALARAPSDRFDSAEAMREALVKAQERAGIRDVDVATVGAWVEATMPSPWTREELEADFVGAGVSGVAHDALADVVTLPPRRDAHVARRADEGALAATLPPTTARRGSSLRIAVGVAGAVLVGVASGAAVFVRSRAPASLVAPMQGSPAAPAAVPTDEPSVALAAPSKAPVPSAVASARVPKRAPPPKIAPSSVPTVASAEPSSSLPIAPPPKKPDVYEQM